MVKSTKQHGAAEGFLLDVGQPQKSTMRQNYNISKIVDAFRNPKSLGKDLRLVSCHRGLRWEGTPENSKSSAIRAAEAGMACIEIDVQVTSDGVPIVMHDDGLGETSLRTLSSSDCSQDA